MHFYRVFGFTFVIHCLVVLWIINNIRSVREVFGSNAHTPLQVRLIPSTLVGPEPVDVARALRATAVASAQARIAPRATVSPPTRTDKRAPYAQNSSAADVASLSGSRDWQERMRESIHNQGGPRYGKYAQGQSLAHIHSHRQTTGAELFAAQPAGASSVAAGQAMTPGAMRSAARGEERSAGQGDSRATLARGIAESVRPDCRKAYAGFGLLALPILGYDALTDSGCGW